MASENLRSKHAFGSLENIQSAIDSGKIDSYDLVMAMDENDKANFGWVDKDGNFRLVKNQDVILVTGDALPESGEEEIIYIFNNSLYYWNGSEFISVSSEGISESEVDSKVAAAVTQANAYADSKVAEVASGYEIVEF